MYTNLDRNRLIQDSKSIHDDLSCSALAVIDSISDYENAKEEIEKKLKEAMEPIEKKLKEAIGTYLYVSGQII